MDKKRVKQIAMGIVLLAFLLNPYTIGLLLSPDQHIENPLTIIIIILFESALIIFGVALYYRERYNFFTQFINNGVLLTLSLLFCFAIFEGTISFLGEYDSDGQFYFAGTPLLPYTLPVNALKEHIAVFENITNPYAIPDVHLGWTIGTNTSSLSPLGYYQTNSIGVRSEKEFNKTKPTDVLRIEMFGDSFVHSYDVPMNDTLAFYLEHELSTKVPTEVMNFGVGAYGIDQAYLRWKHKGEEYNPDIVIIGFQAENCKRNMNIVRKFYFRDTEIPFSKPRFVLVNESLVLVNYPTVPYTEMPELVKDFDKSTLLKYEYYYNTSDYRSRNPLFFFKSIRYAITLYKEYKEKKYDHMNYDEGEVHDLCYAIIEKFYNEASHNATVYVLHLPTQQDLALNVAGENFVYQTLLDQLKKDFPVIDPTDDLIQEAKNTSIDSLFVGHYSGKANEIVANNIAATLQEIHVAEES